MDEQGQSEQMRHEYESLSPRERNQELAKIIDMFPTHIGESVKEATRDSDESMLTLIQSMDRIFKQGRSGELKQLVFEKLNSLLSFSDTTDSFKQVLNMELDTLFYFGIDRTRSTPAHLRLIEILGLNGEDGGIFEPDPSESEKKLYSHYTQTNLELGLYRRRLALRDKQDLSFVEGIEKMSYAEIDPAERKESDERDQKLLSRLSMWKDQFKEKYQEDISGNNDTFSEDTSSE